MAVNAYRSYPHNINNLYKKINIKKLREPSNEPIRFAKARDRELKVGNRDPGLADAIGDAESAESIPCKKKTRILETLLFDPLHAFKMSCFILRQPARITSDIDEERLGLNAKKIVQKGQDLFFERCIVFTINLGHH